MKRNTIGGIAQTLAQHSATFAPKQGVCNPFETLRILRDKGNANPHRRETFTGSISTSRGIQRTSKRVVS